MALLLCMFLQLNLDLSGQEVCPVLALTLALFILVTQTVKVGEEEMWTWKWLGRRVGDNTVFGKNQVTSCQVIWGPQVVPGLS